MAYRASTLTAGDIVLVTGQGLMGFLIRASTASPYTHAVLATGEGTLIEAQKRVVESPAHKYEATGWVFRVAAADAVRTAAVQAARNRIGARYGVRELFLDAARFDLHLTPHTRPLRHYTCSGLVTVCYQETGLTLTYAPWPAPADLSNSPLLVGRRLPTA